MDLSPSNKKPHLVVLHDTLEAEMAVKKQEMRAREQEMQGTQQQIDRLCGVLEKQRQERKLASEAMAALDARKKAAEALAKTQALPADGCFVVLHGSRGCLDTVKQTVHGCFRDYVAAEKRILSLIRGHEMETPLTVLSEHDSTRHCVELVRFEDIDDSYGGSDSWTIVQMVPTVKED